MKKVDLNVDIGEGFPHDEALLDFATSANVCCGEHAGSWELTQRTVELCKRRGARIGCHPGFPDREHMGRRIPTPSEVPAFLGSIADQMRAFYAYIPAAYTKPHGALYNVLCGTATADDETMMRAKCMETLFVQALFIRARVGFVFLADSSAAQAFQAAEWLVASEGFADRRYLADGTLVPRSEPNAVLEDPQEIAEQVVMLAPKVDSICLHGDTPNCLEFAELVYKTLDDAGYEVCY